jgi:hypothetical protein
MAELREWLNQKVLHIDIRNRQNTTLTADIRFVYQQDQFIDNGTGWKTQTQGEIRWYNFSLKHSEISDFVSTTKDWLALPIGELGKTFFSGTWNWSEGENTKFEIEFGPYSQTPSKTDWFIVRLEIASQMLRINERIHVDHSCLAIFVDGLTENA